MFAEIVIRCIMDIVKNIKDFKTILSNKEMKVLP